MNNDYPSYKVSFHLACRLANAGLKRVGLVHSGSIPGSHGSAMLFVALLGPHGGSGLPLVGLVGFPCLALTCLCCLSVALLPPC